MREVVNEFVDVVVVFDQKSVRPHALRWAGRLYKLTELGLHHSYRQGRTLHHVFSAANPELFFRLDFDTETLRWNLTEVSDGEPM